MREPQLHSVWSLPAARSQVQDLQACMDIGWNRTHLLLLPGLLPQDLSSHLPGRARPHSTPASPPLPHLYSPPDYVLTARELEAPACCQCHDGKGALYTKISITYTRAQHNVSRLWWTHDLVHCTIEYTTSHWKFARCKRLGVHHQCLLEQ